MRMTVTWVAAAVSACTFGPKVDGRTINDCDNDSDCPQCGSCVTGVCVPLEPPLGELVVQAVEPTVLADEPCRIEVVGPTCNTHYDFTQVGGPRVGFTAADFHADIATAADYVGDYTVRVRAQTEGGQVAYAQASCTAIIEDYGAFVVPGRSGDCSRENPCGTVADALDTTPVYVYLGVEELDSPTYFVIEPSDEIDPVVVNRYNVGERELHGGFVFPGWTRDLDRALTTLHPSSGKLEIGIVVSGIRHTYVSVGGPLPHGIRLVGDGATLRDSRIHIGGASDVDAVGVYAAANYVNQHVQSCRVEANPGTELRDITAVGGLGRVRVSDCVLDLSAVTTARHNYGVATGQMHIENRRLPPDRGVRLLSRQRRERRAEPRL